MRTTPRLCHNFMAAREGLEHTSCGQQPSLMPQLYGCLEYWLEHTKLRTTTSLMPQLYGCLEMVGAHFLRTTYPRLCHNFMAVSGDWLEHTSCGQHTLAYATTLWLFGDWLEHTCCGQQVCLCNNFMAV